MFYRIILDVCMKGTSEGPEIEELQFVCFFFVEKNAADSVFIYKCM